jgi:hypothetical protein
MAGILPFKLAPSQFVRYELTPAEEVQAGKFSSLNRALLSNLQATTAEEKNALVFDPTNPQAFAQQEAYKAGQLELLAYLLDLDEVNESLLPTEQPDGQSEQE